MKAIPLVSSDSLIGELISDFNITGTDWVGKAYRHITRALDLMELDGYYTLKVSNIEVNNNIGLLPCDRKYMVAVLIDEGNKVFQVPVTRQFDLGVIFEDLVEHDYERVTVNGNYLHTSGRSNGNYKVIYYGTPVCEHSGAPMIPDNPFVFEAIPYYIIQRLSFSGYKHPEISRREAAQEWETLYPRARNNVNYPSLEEMQRFTELHTSPLYSNILDISSEVYKNNTYKTNPALNYATPFRSVDDLKTEE